MRHFLVDVKSIRCDRARSEFDRGTVERLADAILSSGGLVKPLVLRPAGAMAYEVVDRHLEYWASVRAREKDARAGEMVNSYVISQESVEAVEGQLAILRGTEAQGKHMSSPVRQPDTSAIDALGVRLSSIERVLARTVTAEQLEGALQSVLSSVEAAIASAKTAPKRGAKKREFNPEGPYDQENLSVATVFVLKEFMKERGISTGGLRKKQDHIDAIIAFYQVNSK